MNKPYDTLVLNIVFHCKYETIFDHCFFLDVVMSHMDAITLLRCE